MQMIRDVTGINEARDGTMPDAKTLVGVQKLAALNSNTATKHVMTSGLNIARRLCEAISCRISDILQYADFAEDFAKMIGKNNMDVLAEMEMMHLHEFGIFIELEPDDEEKQKFGKGSVNGIAAPETANNAACSGSFVPLLTLGIPGSGTTAVMLGALLGFGIQPGPRLYQTNPEIFWSVIMSMCIGMVVLLILNLPLIPYIARILAVPRNYLIPLILFFSVTGIYLMSFNNFDIFLMIGIAVVATFLRLYDFPMPPLILAFVLGGLMEETLRRSLLISDGSPNFLWDRPITLIILLITITIVGWQIFSTFRKKN